MGDLDYKQLGFWLDLVQWFFLVAISIWAFIDRGRKDNRVALLELTKDVGRIDDRLIALEVTQKRNPSHEDYVRLGRTVSGLEQQIKAQNNLLQTIHNYLLNGK